MSYIEITNELVTLLQGFVGSVSGVTFGAVYGYENSNPSAYPAACIVPDRTPRITVSYCSREATYNYKIIIFFERTAKTPDHEKIEQTIQTVADELNLILDKETLFCPLGYHLTRVTVDSFGYFETPAGRSRTCTLSFETRKRFPSK